MDKEVVKELIRTAFANRPYPGDHGIVGSNAPFVLLKPYDFTDNCDDPIPFVGKKWQEIGVSFFLGSNWKQKPRSERKPQCACADSFMTDEAYRYYLPAFMINSIDYFEELNIIPDFTIYGLTLGDNEQRVNNLKIRRFDDFGSQEVKAIIAFLEYILEKREIEYPDIGPKQALDSYWYQRLEYLRRTHVL